MDDRKLSAREAAEKLGITVDSVRNWTRQGLLTDEAGAYDPDQIRSLILRIDAGELDRLSRRANKSRAAGSFLPREYMDNPAMAVGIRKVMDRIKAAAVPLESALFFLTINLFSSTGDLALSSLRSGTGEADFFSLFKQENFRRTAVWDFFNEWWGRIAVDGEFLHLPLLLLEEELPVTEDLLGIIYQSLLKEGKKSGRGSYYTPRKIVTDLLEGEFLSGGRFLDPACGTGQFLIAMAEAAGHPEKIFGQDLDETAVRIARANLLLKFPELDFTPHIYHENTLLSVENRRESFDFIATNPPWGARSESSTEASVQLIGRDSFSRFLHASWKMLKPGGRMCFVLPEALANVKSHGDIRSFLIEETSLKEITILGKRFQKVMSPVITLKAVKEKPSEEHRILVREVGSGVLSKSGQKSDKLLTHEVLQARFRENRNCLFDLRVNDQDSGIFKKLFDREYLTLKDGAEWGLGIVTGNNRRFIFETGGEGREEVLRGGDIDAYRIRPPGKYLFFEPHHFQQTAPEHIYRNREKLVYRFIAQYPVFALDTGGRLTLNSANILIPRIEGYTLPALLAFLNSALFRYYFKVKFNSVKILRGDLEELPFPMLNYRQLESLTGLAEESINGLEKQSEIDRMIFDFYGFTIGEIQRIEGFMKR